MIKNFTKKQIIIRKRKLNFLFLILISFFLITNLLFSQADTSWIRRYNGPGYGWERAQAIYVDGLGNVYITGTTGTLNFEYDYLTVKYSTNGEELWVRRYDGPRNAWDEATSLVVDDVGNVYVTGLSVGSSNTFDYTTIKYSPNGEELWVRNFDGSSDHDFAVAIGIDNIGNVYVTGSSHSEISGFDIVTIKYSPAGEELWVRRYNAPGNGDDYACALAIDSNNDNVYIAGNSEGGYITIKYDTNGNELWIKRYNGPYNDTPTSIAVDNWGNVYVTGRSYDRNTSSDYATIKYSPEGEELWIRRYNGPENNSDWATDITVDNIGNVYVTGCSEDDYVTIKYSPEGEELWIRRYNGPANSLDWADALAIDNLGNVYVTGYSHGLGTYFDYVTIKYSFDGNEMWVRRYSYSGSGISDDRAAAVTVDCQGNVYVTGESWGSHIHCDCATIKYSSDGEELWARRCNISGYGYDCAYAIAVDNQNNIYVTGGSFGPGTHFDYATIKYSSEGETLWVRRYNGPENHFDEAYSLAVDNSGNVFVTGYSYSRSTGEDCLTIKYSPNGEELWIRRYNGPGDCEDYGYDICVDNLGNVYVTGESDGGPNTSFDYITIKYSPNGEELWIRRYDGLTNSDDCATAITIDSFGNIYVTGYSYNGLNEYDYDIVTIKYSPNGEELWARRYNGPESDEDIATAIATDILGNVYVTGYSYISSSSYDIVTIKYSPNGEELWVRRYNGIGNGPDGAYALAIDNFGNVYITGESYGVDTYSDYVTIKYSPQGEELWVKRYNGLGNGWDEAHDITIDNNGNVYITGCSRGAGTGWDYATIKYSSDGQELWIMRYNGPRNGRDCATAITIDSDNNVYVTGFSYGIGSSLDYLTIKYTQISEVKEERITKIEKKKFGEKIQLYDITGKLVNEKKMKKGIYFRKTENKMEKILIFK